MMSDIDDQAGYTIDSLGMLASKEGQLNAVFACFGSAAQHSQFFEAALSEFLLVYNKICKKSLTLQALESTEAEAKLHRKTMGVLLKEFKKYVTIDDITIEQCLDDALQKRNFLIHRFFRQRQEKFHTKNGRMEMLAELVDIGNVLEKATDLTNGMRVAVSETLGFKDENKTEERDTGRDVLFSIKVNIPKYSSPE